MYGLALAGAAAADKFVEGQEMSTKLTVYQILTRKPGSSTVPPGFAIRQPTESSIRAG
jgi:hypothetical protein